MRGRTYVTKVGIIGPQSLATSAVFSKEASSSSCLTPPSPTEIGSWGGGRTREAVDGAPMAPKMGVSFQLLSVSNEHTGKGLGGREWCLVNSLSGQ